MEGKKVMKKITKVMLIAFIIGFVGLGITTAFLLVSGRLASRDNSKAFEIPCDAHTIIINTDKAHVNLVKSDDMRIELYLNLWADIDIDARDVAVIEYDEGTVIINETAPDNKFFGIFPQPYEIIITVRTPESLLKETEWRRTE